MDKYLNGFKLVIVHPCYVHTHQWKRAKSKVGVRFVNVITSRVPYEWLDDGQIISDKENRRLMMNQNTYNRVVSELTPTRQIKSAP